jgi:hypothetical protein
MGDGHHDWDFLLGDSWPPPPDKAQWPWIPKPTSKPNSHSTGKDDWNAEEVVDLTNQLSNEGGYHHDHDEELGMYWYGASEPPSKEQPTQAASPHTEPAPQAQSDAGAVEQLIDGLRRWQRPDYIGVSRFRGRDDAYWNETRSLVLDYLALQVNEEDFERYRFAFIAWLRASPDFLKAYRDGDDMARAALVDWFVKMVR